MHLCANFCTLEGEEGKSPSVACKFLAERYQGKVADTGMARFAPLSPS